MSTVKIVMRTGALIRTPIDSILLKTGAALTRNLRRGPARFLGRTVPQQGSARFYRYSEMKQNPQDTELS